MVESAEVGDGDDIARATVNLARRWRVAVETQMSTRLVVVDHVSTKDTDKMTFAKGDDVIGAVSSDRADDALSKGILPRRLLCADYFRDVEDSHLFPKHPAVDGVLVAVQVSRFRSVAGKRFDDLLCGPFVRWVPRDVHVDDPAAVVRENDEAVEGFEREARNHEEVAGGSHRHVVDQERAPCLGWLFLVPDHVLGDGGHRDFVAE